MSPQCLWLKDRLLIGRVRYKNELELQALAGSRWGELGDRLEREVRLDKTSRLDFFWREHGIAIEMKISRSLSATFRQVMRYAQFPEVKEVVVVRPRAISLFWGEGKCLNGKPIYQIEFWHRMI